jgi:hypothetical protein
MDVYVFVIGYILYAGILNKIDAYLFAAIGAVVFEGLVLIFFDWRCPLTILGSKYSESREVGFDIFLPKWLAKNNKAIFGTVFAAGVIITIYRIL